MINKLSYYFPDLKGCCILFLLVIGGMFAGGLIVSALIGVLTVAGIAPNWLHAWILPVASLIGYIPVILYIYFKGQAEMVNRPELYTEEGRKFDSNLFGSLHPALFAGMAIMGMAALVILTDAFSNLLPPIPDWVKSSFESIQASLLPSIISTVIIAPIFEEALCRGMILRGLIRNSKPAEAIVLSAAFFALMHLNLWQAIPAFMFGLWFGWLYYKTGSLKTTIGLHALNNLTSLLLSHFGAANMDDTLRTVIADDKLYFLIVLTSVILLILCIFTIHKHIPSRQKTV